MSDIIQDIHNGEFDDQLAAIAEAVFNRRKLVDKRATLGVKAGDRVRFNDRVRPKYMVGVEGTVRSVNRESLRIDLDEPVGKFSGETTIRCPRSILEVIR